MYKRWGVIVAGLIGLVASATGARAQQTPTSKIVFSRDDGTAIRGVWLADETGANEQALLVDQYDNLEPTFCHGTNKVVFASNRAGTAYDIWVIDTDGSNLVNLTPGHGTGVNPGVIGDREPHCSRDGWVVFQSDTDRVQPELYKVPIDGSEGITRLTDNTYIEDDPSWCGLQDQNVVFTREDPSVQCTYGAERPVHIMLMGRQGESDELKQLTCGEHNYKEVSCSPDGKYIAYRNSGNCGTPPPPVTRLARRPVSCTDQCTAPGFCTTPDNSDCFNCSADELVLTLGGTGDNTEPRWSLTGSMIIFASDRTASDGSDDWDLYRIDWEEGETPDFPATEITTTGVPINERSPDWSEVRP